MAPDAKYALVPLFLACSVFGACATLGAIRHNGLGLVVRDVVSGSRAALVGAPSPFKRTYTGIPKVDRQLSILVTFFSAAIDGNVPPEYFLFLVWGMSQFAAGWAIFLLEARRAGNWGRVISYAGVFGLGFQNITWVVALPVWLSLHLLTSPIARLGPNSDKAAATKLLQMFNKWDAAFLPASVAISFLLPAVLMNLSEVLHHSAAVHYTWNAIWQGFPLWNVLLLPLLSRGLGGSVESKAPSTSYIYNFALALCIVTHFPIFVLSLVPPQLRSALASSLSFLPSELIIRGTFTKIFVPPSWPLSATPSLQVVPTAYASGDLAPLGMQFLQYDILTATIPFLLWALYLRQSVMKKASLSEGLAKAGAWLVIGGPHAAVVALLKDRDLAFVGPAETSKKVN